MARISERSGKLLFDFSYVGQRCRELTTLPDSKENRNKLNLVMKKIEAKIELGIFEYREYFPNSKVADKLDKLDLQRRVMKGKSTPQFEDFAEYWFDVMSPTWRLNTISGYRSYYEKRIKPFWIGYEVSRITRQDVLNFRAHVAKLKSENKDKRLDPSTVNKTLKIFRMIINEAADHHEFTSPYRNVQMLKEPKKDIQPFDLDEVNNIINNIQPHFRNYVAIRFFTGLRTGEVDGLKWKYVDFDNRLIKVRETYSNKIGFQYTKNDSSQRDVQMSKLVYETLKEQFDHRYVGEDEATVFTNPTEDGPVHNGNFGKRAWRSVLKKLNLPYRSPYQTRHTTATLWLGAGENPTWIAQQMGHTTTEMLFSTYVRFVPNLTRSDGCAFESLLQKAYGEIINPQTPEVENDDLTNKLLESDVLKLIDQD
jgi:integrase